MLKIAGVVGKGEVGSAICALYKPENLRVKDPKLKLDDDFSDIDVLHLCFPLITTAHFVLLAVKMIEEHKPKLTIIHSTLIPGTTEEIYKKTNAPVVHSPIRGIHPHLHKSLFTFVKYIGGDNEEAADMAVAHLTEMGLKPRKLKNSRSTEVAKILSTTQYGIQLSTAQEMKYICDSYSVDYNEVINDINETYNDGYIALGKPQFKRSVLIPMSEFENNEVKNGVPVVGGHCVSENLKLLEDDLGDEFKKYKSLDLLKKFSKFQ